MKTSNSEWKNGIQWTTRMQLDDLDFADDLALLSQTQQQMQEKTTSVAAASAAQQRTVEENKPDPSGGRNQKEALEVVRTHIEESTELRHKTSPHMEFSRPKEKRKTKEHITPINGDRHEKNEQELDGTRTEWVGECWSAAYAPLGVTGLSGYTKIPIEILR
ncbi:unnamed protein product [Schistosoma margrebowiei]|uniref:Uncharacterized protein n=1 Tax=Schistosoma margrebowiei TaxID=48269 RepID=A0A183MZ26_9TREM|nr:unnamed protein product [Schistosoma margrebowiei]